MISKVPKRSAIENASSTRSEASVQQSRPSGFIGEVLGDNALAAFCPMASIMELASLVHFTAQRVAYEPSRA